EVMLDGGGVVLVGERLATSPGALAAAASLARTSGARLAWVPRRAGDRGAIEAGALPNLLPGGRPVADAAARVDLAAAWGVESLPETVGRDGDAIVAAAAAGELGGLVVGGVDPADLADPAGARAAIDAAAFVVSLELRESEVTRAADVVFPVAPVTDKSGVFVNWEGRVRSFDQVMHVPSSLPDLRVLAGVAEEMGVELGFRTVGEVQGEMREIGPWTVVEEGALAPASTPDSPAMPEPQPPPGTASAGHGGTGPLVLASWKQMLDDGRMQDGDEELRATARKPVLLVNAATLGELGVAAGDLVTVTGPLGSLDLPVGVADLVAGVVWTPASAPDASARRLVGLAGCTVTVAGAARAVAAAEGGDA
ncbi:MAG: molybdopterin-dependent oxidoreductase, partial [Actinomycetota bacterium]|nr:molybdopterin-dependent oxidoreductase [Actinomycetota bacterium]